MPRTQAHLASRPLLVLLLAVALVLPLTTPADASSQDRELEHDVVALVNIERAKEGLGALTVANDITSVARDHSARMARSGELHHNPDFSSQITGWSRVAENVGVGPSVSRIHDALMDSSGHRRNILDDTVTEIGVGVVVRDDRIWVTQNFRRPSSGARSTAPSTVRFGDVSSTNVHARSIETVVDRGIADACGTSRFCPSNSVTRAEFAGMLVRTLDLPPASDGRRFTDLASGQRDDVEALYAAGLTAGCGGDRFCPDRNLTREQMATFFTRALALDPVDASPFTDVGPTHAGSIGALYRAGITRGCTKSTYCPTTNVSRDQTASMLANHLG